MQRSEGQGGLMDASTQCGAAWNSRRASWSWILGPKTLSAAQRLINRPTSDRSWFQTALHILPSEIKSFPDLDRRSYRICDTSGPACELGPGDTVFQELIEMDELERYDEYKLLEFGGLYGGGRLTLRSEANKAIKKWADKQMAFKEMLLNEISDAVAERLGGRNKYVGLHLRVGGSGDKFKVSSESFVRGGSQAHSALVCRTSLSNEPRASSSFYAQKSTASISPPPNPSSTPTVPTQLNGLSPFSPSRATPPKSPTPPLTSPAPQSSTPPTPLSQLSTLPSSSRPTRSTRETIASSTSSTTRSHASSSSPTSSLSIRSTSSVSRSSTTSKA